MSDSDRPLASGGAAGHELRDVSFRPIVLAGAGLIVVLAVVSVLMLWLFDYFAAREARLSPPENPLAAVAGPLLPPAPRLQTHPIRDLQDLRSREDATLESYGWVDRSAGVVRIPIDRAMDLVAARPAAPDAPRPKRRRR